MKIAIQWLVGCLLTATVLVACSSPPAPPPTAAPPTAAPPTTAPPASPPTATTSGADMPTPGATETATTTGLLINLATDDTWSANMALSLATTARDQGLDPVIVFLNVRGVYLADRERLPTTEGNSKLNIHEKLQAFIAAGGQVIACPSCSQEAGLTQEDYIDGVVLGEPGGILRFLRDPAINVISYPGQNERE